MNLTNTNDYLPFINDLTAMRAYMASPSASQLSAIQYCEATRILDHLEYCAELEATGEILSQPLTDAEVIRINHNNLE